ncbi:stalk domain-containing protein [Paenibacillus sp. YYML68]|uniref:stalk domain-containing protein n=1 Tax=Paenibacillus sp. YYML68 TaxID=2909250 RepID=UPI0024917FE0|nr:stalk domain-containing protein [Paenibacillus sp. YYML68]
MNDKLKGLVLGLSLGAMLTGTAAFAGGTQIEVYFRELKYMFDGVQKIPNAEQGAGFIYNGTTYVPLRFVSESIGKDISFDNDTGTIYVGKRIDKDLIVATYTGGQVTLGDLYEYMLIVSGYDPYTSQYELTEDELLFALKSLVSHQLLAARLSPSDAPAIKAKAEAEYMDSIDYYEFTTDGQKQALRKLLELSVQVDHVLAAGATDDVLKAAYDQKLKTDEYTVVSVRQLEIGYGDLFGITRTKEEAMSIASKLSEKLAKGADFEKLIEEEENDEKSIYSTFFEEVPVNSWEDDRRASSLKLPINEISKPLDTTYSIDLMRIEQRRTLSFDEVKESLRDDYMTKAYDDFIRNEMPSLVQYMELPKP